MKNYSIGAVPVLIKNNQVYLIIVTTRANLHWIFPKGHREKKHKDRKVALMEAFEEAGVKGNIFYGPYTCKVRGKKQKNYFINVKKLKNTWPEDHERQRQIVKLKKAKKILTDKGHRKIIKQLKLIVEGDVKDSL